MTNKKRKGFTIVELVIVIAVVAILAGVLIPTFAGVIEKANQSTDIQAVRQMNVVLMAESVENEPTGIGDVINIVAEAGYDTVEKRTPKSNNHGFYWHSGENLIVLVKGTSELIYPNDNEELNQLFEGEVFTIENNDNFKNLAVEGGTGGNESGSNEDAAGLIAALTDSNETGTIILSNDIVLSLDTLASIDCTAGTADTPFVIDLNNKTLTLTGTVSLNILNNITIKNGKINITNIYEYIDESIMDEDWFLFDTLMSMPGFYVSPTGRLSIKNVNILGSRDYCVENDGEITLTNTNWNLNGLYMNGIYGLYNNNGTATINVEGEGYTSTFTSTEEAQPIYSIDGNISINDTKFIEDPSFISYGHYAPVYIDGGTTALINLDFSESTKSVYAMGEARVTISNCTIGNTKLSLQGENTAYIFENFNGVDNSNNPDNPEIDILDIFALDRDEITVIKTTVNNVTTYIAGWLLTPSCLSNILTYEESKLTIAAEQSVIVYLGKNGFRVRSPIDLYGTLEFYVSDGGTGQLYGKDDAIDIIVNPNSILKFGPGISYRADTEGGPTLAGGITTFINNYVTNNGGTVIEPQ